MKHFLAGAIVELVKLFAAAHAVAISRKGARQSDRMARVAMNEAAAIELSLLRARLERLDSAKRPRYLPQERLQILLYRARYSVMLKELARRFVLSVETIKEWLVEVDGGVEARVKTTAPVNKLPHAVREIAILLRWEQLRWGARRIADILRRMNLKISRTSIQRILRRNPRRPAVATRKSKRRTVGIRAKRENHVWLVDLTYVTAFLGLLRVRVVAIMDAYTRAVVATGVSTSEPTADWMCTFVSGAMKAAGTKPVHFISDRGSQFTATRFRAMLRRRGIRHRFGAVGCHGSIALIERFWRTLKTERLDSTCVWMSARTLARKVASYAAWFNSFRPHQGLRGRSPREVAAKLPVYTLRLRKSA